MKAVLATILGATCGLALMSSTASAEIACNREGDCWHVRETHHFQPEHGVVIHPDDWKWAEHEHDRYRWREHEGRGYWHEGHWVEIH
jgi:hypothetical protein